MSNDTLHGDSPQEDLVLLNRSDGAPVMKIEVVDPSGGEIHTEKVSEDEWNRQIYSDLSVLGRGAVVRLTKDGLESLEYSVRSDHTVVVATIEDDDIYIRELTS